MHVAHLKAGTLTREAARAQGRHAALVGDLGQRVGLVHKLRQGVGTKECVDDRRYCLCVDQVDWGEHLVVAHIHALAYGAGHAGQAHAKLVVELLAHGAHAAVAQVVDIIDVGLAVDKADEVLDDLDDVLAGEHSHVVGGRQAQLLVDAETAHIAQVITLLAEEKVVDHLAGAGVIRRLGVAQLPVYVVDCLFLRVAGILGERVEDDGIVARVHVLAVQQYGLCARFQYLGDVALLDHGVAVDNHLVALDRNDLASILVDEVFVPCFHDTGGELAAHCLLKVGLVYFEFLGQAENLDDVVVGLETDGTQQSCHGQLLLAVDVGIHHVVDIGGKFNPRSTERYDASRI